jgi:hypothetical protein
MRKLVALGWVLGMSLRGVVTFLSAFGVNLSHMTVWRDMQEQAELLEKRRRWQPVRVLGVDGVYPLGKDRKRPVIVAVDLGNGQPIAIGKVDESDPQAVRRWLEPLVKRLGVSVIVTDDLASYRIVVEKLGLEHQVCQFHVRAGSDVPCMNSGKLCPRSGCGCSMKSVACLTNCHLRAVAVFLSFGNRSLNVVSGNMVHALHWCNYAIC